MIQVNGILPNSVCIVVKFGFAIIKSLKAQHLFCNFSFLGLRIFGP